MLHCVLLCVAVVCFVLFCFVLFFVFLFYLLNHYPIEDRFVECALGATQPSFRLGQFTVEQMLEKPESATKNKESRDIGHIGEIK
jgi:hypothetical protein